MTDPVQLITHKIIFLNGPPGSGKDVVAQHIMSRLPGVRHRKFSMPLKRAAREMFSIGDELWKQLEVVGSQSLKDEPRPEFLGKSWRQVLISLSEQHMKPNYGVEVFGELLKNNLMQPTGGRFSVISDSGFAVEALPIIKYFGPRNCSLWRLHRPGCDFGNDSRGYWTMTDTNDQRLAIDERDINNEHELDMFKAQINFHVKKFTGIDLSC